MYPVSYLGLPRPNLIRLRESHLFNVKRALTPSFLTKYAAYVIIKLQCIRDHKKAFFLLDYLNSVLEVMTTWNSHNLAINVHRSKFLLATNVPTTQIGRHEFAWKDLTDEKPA